MKYVISRFNHNLAWLSDYTRDYDLYDRSERPLAGAKVVPNIGSDLYDKFCYIIDNYDNLPEVAVYTKANLFDYIKPREFEKIKNNTTFTPILSQDHHTYLPVCYYENNLYHEINNYFYLGSHSARYFKEITEFFNMGDRDYNAFAPGSNYILPRENIRKHDRKVYELLRSYLEWDVYPGDAQLIERNLYYLWK